MSARDGLLDLRPLRASPAFTRLWLGQGTAAFGGQVANVAVLYQVWELTHSAFWTGAIGLARAVPQILLGLVGGVLADLYDRRSVLRVTVAGQVLAALGLAWQAWAGLDSLALVLALVSLQTGFLALGMPAARSVPARLLPLHLVPAAVALQHIGFQAAMLGGPALAGVVLAQVGLTACYLLQAGLSAVGLVAVVSLPALPPAEDRPNPGVAALVEGVRYVVRRPLLRDSFLADLFATVLAMPIALFPLVNEERFGGDPQTLGFFLSAVAVGGVLAGFGSGTFTRAARLGMLQLVAGAVWGLALAVFGLVGGLGTALAALVVAGAADTVSVVTRAAMVQLVTPDSHRGRVGSVEHVIALAGPDVGNFRGGVVADLTSAPVALVSGGLLSVVGIGWLAWRDPELRRFSTRR